MQKLPNETIAQIHRIWDRAVGKVISAERRGLKISQEELGKYMGWRNRSTVSRIERGVRPVAIREIPILARLLNMSVTQMTDEIYRQATARPREVKK